MQAGLVAGAGQRREEDARFLPTIAGVVSPPTKLSRAGTLRSVTGV